MINQFSVFKKIDQATKKTNYIINTGDIHNILPKFNLSQCNEIKKIIQDSTDRSLFLFEYPFNLAVDNESIKKCRDVAALAVNKINNPVFLHDFAELHNKACNIDHRASTLIFNIFSNLLQDFINSKSTGIRELNIGFGDISKLMISTFDKIVADYNELKIMAEKPDLTRSLKVMVDVYINYFEQYQAVFEENKSYAEELAKIDDEIIDYLISKFAEYKNCESDLIINELVNNDLKLAKEFGYYAGQHYIQKIGLSFFNTIELNILKEVINNYRRPKIFIFTGMLHANNMNEILIKCGYVKIYENISTSIEDYNQLATSVAASGRNILSDDIAELVPVRAELLSKLAEKKLTKELFETELSSKSEVTTENVTKVAPSVSWIRKIFNFLNI